MLSGDIRERWRRRGPPHKQPPVGRLSTFRPVTRAWSVTVVLLAALVVAFALTWMTMPSSNHRGGERVDPPASWFAVGGLAWYGDGACVRRLGDGTCVLARVIGHYVDAHAVRRRIYLFYGTSAVVILLLGLVLSRRLRPTIDELKGDAGL
jgi:hypothetical protein